MKKFLFTSVLLGALLGCSKPVPPGPVPSPAVVPPDILAEWTFKSGSTLGSWNEAGEPSTYDVVGLNDKFVAATRGEGKLQFFNATAKITDFGYTPSSTYNGVRLVAKDGTPYTVGSWPEDYWLLTSSLEEGPVVKGTKLCFSINTETTSVSSHPAYWVIEASEDEGQTWNPVDEPATIIEQPYHYKFLTKNIEVLCRAYYTLQNNVKTVMFRSRAIPTAFSLDKPATLGVMRINYAAISVDTPAPVQPLKIGTFNILIQNTSYEDYEWTGCRIGCVHDAMAAAAWDIVGIQEAKKVQVEDLAGAAFADLGYTWELRDRGDGEHVGIGYRASSVSVSDVGMFWLGDDPSKRSYFGSGGSDPDKLTRIAVYATVKHLASGREYFYIATHTPLTDWQRFQSAKLIVDKEKELNVRGLPAIVVGDMNASATEASIQYYLDHGFLDSYTEVLPSHHSGGFTTFVGKTTTEVSKWDRTRIDYVLLKPNGSGIRQWGYKVNYSMYKNARGTTVYPSDHLPVEVVL